MTIKISSAKAKGRNLQYWVCKKISSLLNIEYNQQDDTCEIHSREMGQHGCDIVLRGKARELFQFDVECKSSQKWDVFNAIKQAKSNTQKNRNWLCVFKRKEISPVIMLDADVFFSILKKGEHIE